MSKEFKNIAIAVSLNEDSQNTLKTLRGNKIFQNAHVCLVHTVTIYTYLNEVSLNTYPADKDYSTIEKLVNGYLQQLKTDIFANQNEQPENIETYCRFHANPKHDMVEFLKEQKTDLVVVATRGKHGMESLFSSSFTEYLSKFAPCDILVLRNRK